MNEKHGGWPVFVPQWMMDFAGAVTIKGAHVSFETWETTLPTQSA
jgi:hypothetical protein